MLTWLQYLGAYQVTQKRYDSTQFINLIVKMSRVVSFSSYLISSLFSKSIVHYNSEWLYESLYYTHSIISTQFLGLWEFITKLRDGTQQLEARLRKTQANIARMRSVASAWAREPLFSRGKSKNTLPLPSPPTTTVGSIQRTPSMESDHSVTSCVTKR
jgi:hypothetical protein